MDNSRRRRITLTQWLLIVIVGALVSNAVLQTISIMQHNESAHESGATFAEIQRRSKRPPEKSEASHRTRIRAALNDCRTARRSNRHGPDPSLEG